MTYRLHAFYRSSASYRVRLGLAHKDLPYEVVPVSLTDGAQHAEAHRALNPIAQVPVLEIEGPAGAVHLAQSLAILEYLDEIHPEPPLLPGDPLARSRVRELAELVNAGIQPLQNLSVLRHVASLGADPEAWARGYVHRGLRALAARASATHGAFLVGDAPTLADVCLVPQMFNARFLDVDLDGLELLVEIDGRCRALPRWSRAHPSAQPDAPAQTESESEARDPR